jgi:hypothetical protein
VSPEVTGAKERTTAGGVGPPGPLETHRSPLIARQPSMVQRMFCPGTKRSGATSHSNRRSGIKLEGCGAQAESRPGNGPMRYSRQPKAVDKQKNRGGKRSS